MPEVVARRAAAARGQGAGGEGAARTDGNGAVCRVPRGSAPRCGRLRVQPIGGTPSVITVVAAADEATVSHGDTLSLLLSVEGFMFAAISLAVTLGAPDQRRQPKFPKLKPEKLLLGAVASLSLVAVGALASWVLLFTGGSYRGLAVALEAGALLVGILAQPVIALLLALAARRG